MVAAANYEISVSDGHLHAGGGESRIPFAVIIIGDSNVCGDGAGVSPELDYTQYRIYSLSDVDTTARITEVDTSSTPYIDHALNSGANEVGPDLSFIAALRDNRHEWRRAVALGAGDSGSGFSTAQWEFNANPAIGDMWDHLKALGDSFHAKYPMGEIKYCMINLGANDTGDYVPASFWRDKYDALIGEIRNTIFNYTETQPDLSTMPIVCNGLPLEWVGAMQERLDVHNYIVDTPNRLTYTGYADTTGLRGQTDDPFPLLHVGGPDNRFLGSDRAWTALIAAEANT